MPGLRNLPMNKLNTAFMLVSAAMIVFAVALAPAESASFATLIVWIAGALVLIGVWAAVGVEVVKRLFGGGQPEERSGERQHEAGS